MGGDAYLAFRDMDSGRGIVTDSNLGFPCRL